MKFLLRWTSGPKWDVNIVLKGLLSKEFCPPESDSFVRLDQKTFLLSLIGTSRRAHEICNLSLGYRRVGDRVLLFWPPSFRAKIHNEEHSPSCTSIRKMFHLVRNRKEIDNCPV